MSAEMKRFQINQAQLPLGFPTHLQTSDFWEALGRTVATFGVLEEVLGKAIFAFTGNRRVPKDRAQAEFEKWLATLERALSDPLRSLTDLYGKAVRDYDSASVTYLDDLLSKLAEVSNYRNMLCHASWRAPDQSGKSLPIFVDRKMRVFDTPIGVEFINATRQHVVELICAVSDSVTLQGWQFPGSTGPGQPVYQRETPP